ncbi:hypothetical protein GCM10009544_04200 [Streptomyces stramineus]|uniref:Uncharacterized protein n=1 Tax=Streptomyces stramineus TaxID=173861 RepID=A0ABN0ZDU3_9ACTN
MHLGAAGAQEADEDGLFEGGQGVLDHRGEHAGGADLHERGDTLGFEGAHGGTETDALADLPDPVCG